MPQTTAAPISQADIDYIRSRAQVFVQHMLARDFELLSRMYAEDARLMPPHSPAVQSRAAIRAWMSAFPNIVAFVPEVQEVFGYEDLAYARGAYKMTIDTGNGTVEDTGKYIEIHRKQPDGTWLIAIDIFNSDRG